MSLNARKVFICVLSRTGLACSLDLFASIRVVRSRPLFSSFSITIFKHLSFSHRSSFTSILISLSTNHTTHSHRGETVSTNTTNCGLIYFFWCLNEGHHLYDPTIPSQLWPAMILYRLPFVCELFLSVFEGFAL